MVLHFYSTFLNHSNISSLFSGGTIISSTSFTTLSAILFPINTPAASTALYATFLVAVFSASSPVSNNCFSYLLVFW